MRRFAMLFVVLVGLLLTSNVASARHGRARVYVPGPRPVPHSVYRHGYVPYAVPYHHRHHHYKPYRYPNRAPVHVPYYGHRYHFDYGGRGFSLQLGF